MDTKPEPGPQHDALARYFAGRWRAIVKIWVDPAKPPSLSRGVMTGTPILDGHYIQQAYESAESDFRGHGMIGFNAALGLFESFWVDSMSTAMQYERGRAGPDGFVSLDLAGQTMFLGSKAPLTHRSLYRYLGADRVGVEKFVRSPSETLRKVMDIVYERDEA